MVRHTTLAIIHVTVKDDGTMGGGTFTEIFKIGVSPLTGFDTPDPEYRLVLSQKRNGGGFAACEDLGMPDRAGESWDVITDNAVSEGVNRIPAHFPDREIVDIDTHIRSPVHVSE